MSEMGHDLDPWAALNLKQHENVIFFFNLHAVFSPSQKAKY